MGSALSTLAISNAPRPGGRSHYSDQTKYSFGNHGLASFPKQDMGASVAKSWEENSRIFRERNKVTNARLRTEISAVLAPFPAKVIAQSAGSSIGTAQNARDGSNTLSLSHFLNLCREIPELRALAMTLMGCEGHADPEFIRGMHHLINSYIRKD